MSLRELITTLFDVLAALLVAGGVFYLAWDMWGLGAGLGVAGVFLALVSAMWAARQAKQTKQEG